MALPQDVNLHQLRLLCAVIEAGSVSRASELLFITQPALTIQIKRLEAALGVRLTERQGRRLVATPVGAGVYQAAKALLAQQARLLAAVEAEKAGAPRPLVVGVTHNGFHRLVPMLSAFRARHPDHRLSVAVEPAQGLLGRVVDGSVDVGFAWDYTRYAGASWQPLDEEEFALVAHPGGGLPARLSRSGLGAAPFVAIQNGPAVSYVEEALARMGVQLNVAMRVPSIEMAKSLVAAGLGVSILPLSLIASELDGGALRRIAVPGLPLRRGYGYLLRRPVPPSPALERFVAFLAGQRRLPAG